MTTDSGMGPEPEGSDSEGDVTEGLPAGWAWATINELCDVNPRGFDEEPGDDELISQVPMAAVEAATGRMDAAMQVRYGDIKGKSLTRFQENDVLFAKITPCMENGKIAKAQGLAGGRALGSTEFHVLRSRGAILSGYLMHFLLQRHIRRVAERHMTGAVGQRRVPRPYLAKLEIPVPPLAEQHRIVAKLNDQLAHVEAGEAIIRTALLDFTRLEAETLEAALKEINPKVFSVGELVCEPLSNGKSVRTLEGGFPVLRLNSVHGEFVDLSIRKGGDWSGLEPTAYRVRHGDFLVVRGNGNLSLVGRGALVPRSDDEVAFPDTLIRVRPDRVKLIPDFLNMIWDSRNVRSQIESQARTTAGIYKINQDILSRVEIPCPSLVEQRAVVKKIQEARSRYAPLRTVVEGIASEALELRDALLHAAFTGTLVAQNLDDEPASVLLDRIRGKRGAGAKPAKRKRAPCTTSPAAPQTSGRPVPFGTQEALPL
ncbi:MULTISPECIES: restriction endonuclease subunit S [unclassified Streptomyces]|uniref:restriction endonuclease subunit S n=1 Tax=unclassified Streptomyces TaxID=2593676 RepID=UPI0038285E91